MSAKLVNGNESDKVINKNLLGEVSKKMRELGQDDPVYVGDSALVTEDNLDLLADAEKGCRFITRLPRTYKECREVVSWAVEQSAWQDIGIISPQRPTAKRQPAHYRCFENEVDLYGRRYRALVVHSDALDKKSVKRFEREIEQDKNDLTKIKKDHEKIIYACLPDAERALSRLPRGKFHYVAGEIYEIYHYPQGRPKDDEVRKPTRIDYRLDLDLKPYEESISRSQHEAGCFVLLTNIHEEDMKSYDLLATAVRTAPTTFQFFKSWFGYFLNRTTVFCFDRLVVQAIRPLPGSH